MKILTMRHFLFYMGMACVATVIVWGASEVLSWSNGLTVAVLVVVETLVSVVALRESLFAPATRSGDGQASHHA
jgi:hypothetical protein